MMNLHNHTIWSDGTLKPEEIVEEAIKGKLKYIGISDHYETTKTKSISKEDIEKYIKEITELKKKYEGKIHLLVGIEIDFSERTDVENISYDTLNKLDYVMYEYVQDDFWNGFPLWELLLLRKNIKKPVGLAHNEVGKNFQDVNLPALMRVLENNNIFIELAPGVRNSKLGKPYYYFAGPFFKELKQYQIPISIGSDTHNSLSEVCNIQDAVDFIENLGLKENLDKMRSLLE